MRIRWMLMLAVLLAHGDAALAQLGNIEAVVVDPQGNVVVHVPVSLVDRQGKSVHQTVTNDRGQFSFRSIIPGEYVLKIAVTGFKSAIRTLDVGETRLDDRHSAEDRSEAASCYGNGRY